MAQCPVLHWLEPCATVGQAAQEPQWLGSLLVFTHSSPQGVGAAAAGAAGACALAWLAGTTSAVATSSAAQAKRLRRAGGARARR